MTDNRLHYLIRKNKGKVLIKEYSRSFITAGFLESELLHIDLKESDEVLSLVRLIFPLVEQEIELLNDDASYNDSRLLTKVFDNDPYNMLYYIYADDVYYCGMYLASSNSVRKFCLKVANESRGQTCFIVDKDYRFSITINYLDKSDIKENGKYDIHLKLRK